MQIQLLSDDPDLKDALINQAITWGITPVDDGMFALVHTGHHVELRKLDEPKLGGIFVDFAGGAVAHRRRFGGGKGQSIAKAVGLNKGAIPTVLDATAGLGRDAFVLASLGCRVQMIERNPVVAMLLQDGLNRAYQDSEIGPWVRERMTLIHASSLLKLEAFGLDSSYLQPDVVYLDPMYPHPQNKKQTALIKKEMRVFQSLVGKDDDADSLLPLALSLARKRVVVKRPDYASWLNEQKPTMAIATKKNRFDVYVNAAMGQG